MADETSISNMALGYIGVKPLTLFGSDGTKEDNAAGIYFAEARKAALGWHDWNFARKRAQLTAYGTDPTYGWDYSYHLPTDFIRLIRVHPVDDEYSSMPYSLETQTNSSSLDIRTLLANSSTCYITYVFDTTNYNAMSAPFRDMFAFLLARMLAPALNKSAALTQLNDDAFAQRLSAAKAVDGIENYPTKMAEGSWSKRRGRRRDFEVMDG